MVQGDPLAYGMPILWLDHSALSRVDAIGSSVNSWPSAYGPTAEAAGAAPVLRPGPNGARAVELVSVTRLSTAFTVAVPSEVTVAAVVRCINWNSSAREFFLTPLEDLTDRNISTSSGVLILRNDEGGPLASECYRSILWIGFGGQNLAGPRVAAPHGMTGDRWAVIAASMSSTQANLTINGQVPSSFVARNAGVPSGTLHSIGWNSQSSRQTLVNTRVARMAMWPVAMSEKDLVELSYEWMGEFGLASPKTRKRLILFEPPQTVPVSISSDSSMGSLDGSLELFVIPNISLDSHIGQLGGSVELSVTPAVSLDSNIGELGGSIGLSVTPSVSLDSDIGQLGGAVELSVTPIISLDSSIGELGGSVGLSVTPIVSLDSVIGQLGGAVGLSVTPIISLDSSIGELGSAVEFSVIPVASLDSNIGELGGSVKLSISPSVYSDSSIGELEGSVELSVIQVVSLDSSIGELEGTVRLSVTPSVSLDSSIGELGGVGKLSVTPSVFLDSSIGELDGAGSLFVLNGVIAEGSIGSLYGDIHISKFIPLPVQPNPFYSEWIVEPDTGGVVEPSSSSARWQEE